MLQLCLAQNLGWAISKWAKSLEPFQNSDNFKYFNNDKSWMPCYKKTQPHQTKAATKLKIFLSLIYFIKTIGNKSSQSKNYKVILNRQSNSIKTGFILRNNTRPFIHTRSLAILSKFSWKCYGYLQLKFLLVLTLAAALSLSFTYFFFIFSINLHMLLNIRAL